LTGQRATSNIIPRTLVLSGTYFKNRQYNLLKKFNIANSSFVKKEILISPHSGGNEYPISTNK
ncbi:MAG: hypothetical protein ACOCTM_04445, partial [Bacteroidota bacterium]